MLFWSLLYVEIAELNTCFLKKTTKMTEGALWSTVSIKVVRKLKFIRNGGLKEKEQHS